MLKYIKNIISYLKWLFRKPKVVFNTPPNFRKMVKDQNFYELRKYLPEFKTGKYSFSRTQSLLLLGVAILVMVFIHPLAGLAMIFGIVINTAYAFTSAALEQSDLKCVLLDSTHFVCIYSRASTGYSVFGTISGTSISYGAESQFTGSQPNTGLAIEKIDSTHFIITYTYYSGTQQLRSKVGTVSGTSISYGSEYTVQTGNCYGGSIMQIDATRYLISYGANDLTYQAFKIATTSGSTISFSSAFTMSGEYFISSMYNMSSLTKLDSTHAIYTYCISDYYVRAVVVTFSTTTVSFGTPLATSFYQSNVCSVAILDSTHFVLATNDSDYYGRYVVGTVSGTTISFGSTYTLDQNRVHKMGVVAIDSTHIFLAYTLNNTGYVDTATISGTTITFDTKTSFGSTDGMTRLLKIDSTNFLITYAAQTTSYGNALLASLPTAPTVTTQAVTDIKAKTATGNGNVTSDGGATITERGVCWKTSTGPTTSDSKATASGTTGAFTASMTSLAPKTLYYVRAYAINSVGTSYGNEVTFTTDVDAQAGFLFLTI